jgi:hypothetical protein
LLPLLTSCLKKSSKMVMEVQLLLLGACPWQWRKSSSKVWVRVKHVVLLLKV